MDDTGQSALIAFLLSPAAFGGAGPARTIETHISRVLLVGDRALKLKKPVRLPYLDLTTPERRLELCERELALNRRTAPDLYRRVLRITRTAGGELACDGSGALVDAVLDMRRFDETRTFDRLAERGELTPALLEDLAAAIDALHAQAPVAADPCGAARMARVLAVNEKGFAAAGHLDEAQVAAANAACRAALSRHAATLDARARSGRVRRGHGDLHLRNICLFDGKPLLFDCLEFDEDLATTDVLYDLAFALMDLWHRGLKAQANTLANRYLDRTGDEAGMALLPFFMAVRAAVRSHVAAAEAREGHAGKAQEALAYLELCSDLLRPRPALLLAVGGYSGSGKSTIAAALAPRLGPAPGARIAASDRLRKALFGVAAQTRLPAEAYAPAVSAEVYARQAACADRVLRQGHAAVADAVFDRAEDRARIAAVAAAAGVPFRGLWLDVPADVLHARVEARRGDPSDATPAVLAAQLARGAGPTGWTVIPAGGTREEATAAALAGLGTG